MTHVHVLVPVADTKISWTNAEDEYSLEELSWLQDCLKKLGYSYTMHRTSLNNYRQVISSIEASSDDCIIFNLCDGTENDGRPGQGVLNLLRQTKLKFTGANAEFNLISTSKALSKSLFLKNNVLTPNGVTSLDKDRFERNLRFPLIVKPDVSYGAIGVKIVHNKSDLISASEELIKEFGASGEIPWIAEEFIQGREFTALVIDTPNENGSIDTIVYPVLERIFDSSLKPQEQFFSTDVYWKKMFTSALAPEDESFELKRIAHNAYKAVNGTGYGRVDMRMNSNNEIFVLEVNALCGLSNSSDSSVGLILHQSKMNISDLVSHILNYASMRT